MALTELIRAARHLDALVEFGEPSGLDRASSPEVAHTHVRLLHRLGAYERGWTLALRTFRAAPRDPWAQHLYLSVVAERRGPFAVWEAAQRLVAPGGARRSLARWRAAEGVPPELAPYWLFLAAQTLIDLRDFTGAEEIADALARSTEPSWAADIVARVHYAADRREAALEVVRPLLAELGNRAALHVALDVLRDLRREDEARALLAEQEARLQCGETSRRLAHMELGHGALEGAEAALDRAAERLPLRGAIVAHGIEAMRVAIAYESGDLDRARALAAAMDSPSAWAFGERIASLDAKARAAKVVRIAVPFVAQHHLTCVPASLTALLLSQGVEVDQAEIADSICHDGTKPHDERAWAIARGLHFRELTLDFDVAVALVDRGIAFSLVLVTSMSAHMVVVVGYDARLGLLLVRDPSRPDLVRLDASDLDTCYGPRAAVVLRSERAHLLDGLTLPETDQYDLLHDVHHALEEDDVPAARALVGRMAEGARLTRWADRAIAFHVGDLARAAAICEALLAEDADDHRSRSLLASIAARTTSGEARVARLRALADHASAQVAPVHAVLGGVLLGDARRLHEARAAARRCLRAAPLAPEAIGVLARAALVADREGDAFELARVAAMLSHAEDHAPVMTRIAFAVGRRAEAFAVLRPRAEGALVRSGMPSMTLAEALAATHRFTEASDVVDRALVARPTDRALLVSAAWFYARAGDRAAVRSLSRRIAALGRPDPRVDALRAALEGRLDDALAAWRAELAATPTSVVAAERTVALIAATRSPLEARSAALEAIRGAGPGNEVPMRAALRAALADPEEHEEDREDAGELLSEVDRLLAEAREKIALHALDEADARLVEALAIEPRRVATWRLRASIARLRGSAASTTEHLRRAARLDVDAPGVVREIVRAAATSAEAEAAVVWIGELVAERTVSGASVDALVAAASGLVRPSHLLDVLERVRAARPSCWVAAMATAELRVAMGKRSTGLALAKRVAEALPRDVDAIARRVEVELDVGDARVAYALARRAHGLAPSARTALLVARTVEVRAPDRAERIVRAAARRFPRNPGLCEVGLRVGAAKQAPFDEAAVVAVLALHPTELSLWNALAMRLDEASRPRVLEAAIEIAGARRDDPRALQVVSTIARALGRWPIAVDYARRARARLPADPGTLETLLLALIGAGELAEADALAEDPPLVGVDRYHALARPLLRVLADEGASAKARARARAGLSRIIEQHAGVLLARQALLDEAEGRGARDEARVLAERAVELSPWSEPALRRLGQIYLDTKESALARKTLERIHRLAPTDPTVARIVLDLRFESGEIGGDAFELAGRIADVGLRARYLVRVLLVEERDAEARQVIVDLARTSPLPVGHFEQCVELYRSRWWLGPLIGDLDALAGANGAPSGLVRAWAQIRDRFHARADRAAFLASLSAASRAHALAALVARDGARGGFFWWNVREIHRTTVAWGEVARQWIARRRAVAVAVWGRGVERRGGLRPWMLLAIATARRKLFGPASAVRVHRLALTLPGDGTVELHRWCLALQSAIDGDAAAAAAHAAEAGEAGEGEPIGEIRRWTRLLLEVHGRADRRHGLQDDVRSIHQHRAALVARKAWPLDLELLAPEVERARRALAGESRPFADMRVPFGWVLGAAAVVVLLFALGLGLALLRDSARDAPPPPAPTVSPQRATSRGAKPLTAPRGTGPLTVPTR